MRARIEKVGPGEPEEVVIRCSEVTPEVEAIVRQVGEPVAELLVGDL
jgi:hypothetical protein